FKLDAAGEYLALVQPDGTHVASEFTPLFPPQFPDVSYGLSMLANVLTLVATNSPVRYLVPTDSSIDGAWMQPTFADNAWTAATNGFGYETGLPDPLENSYAANVLQYGPALYWRLDETDGTTAHNLGALGTMGDGTYQGGVVLGGAGPRPPQFAALEPDNRA